MTPIASKRTLPAIRSLVVKVGSAVIAPGGSLQQESVNRLADDLAAVRSRGIAVTVVSSGAIASGFRSLGLAHPPTDIELKQAAAAIGQQRLMQAWSGAFDRHQACVGQLLLTSDDMQSRQRYLNARHTIHQLHRHGVVPIINENDSVSYSEIYFGDNDALSAYVSGLVDADLLVILSSAAGLYENGDPARVIDQVRLESSEQITSLGRHVSSAKTATGVGGMGSKLSAIGIAWSLGVPAIIAGGSTPGVVARLLSGESLGTFFSPVDVLAPSRRKAWIASTVRPHGAITVDDGARAALLGRGASLLPKGVMKVEGAFDRGEPVNIIDSRGVLVARGLPAYDSRQIDRVRGRSSSEIEPTLGLFLGDEIIHRDDLVLLLPPDNAQPGQEPRP